MSQENNMFGILLGTAIGFGIGVLIAPDKGSVTRKRIADNTTAAKEATLTEIEKLKEDMVNKAGNVKSNIALTLATKKVSLDSQLETLITDASYKADDVISSLEEKLKTLKEKNKKLQTK